MNKRGRAPFSSSGGDTHGGRGGSPSRPRRASHHQREGDGPRESGRPAVGHRRAWCDPGTTQRHHGREEERSRGKGAATTAVRSASANRKGGGRRQLEHPRQRERERARLSEAEGRCQWRWRSKVGRRWASFRRPTRQAGTTTHSSKTWARAR